MEPNIATILCVDEDENQLELRKFVLQRTGYRVITASSAERAIELFRSELVDLVVVDYFMPRISSISLAQELKQARNLPVVILSAYAELPDETLGSADVWITKGMATDTLLARVGELLQKAEPSA